MVNLGATATFEAIMFPSATPTWTFGENIDPSLYVLTPYAPPTAIPTATPAIQPPCTFPLEQTIAEESKQENYTFSEPQVVMTARYGIDIVEWLPDNQNALIMTAKLINLGINKYRQTIELFNPVTKETQIYANRWYGGGWRAPAWNSALKAVIYPDTKIIGTKMPNVKFISRLRISYGNSDKTQLLLDDLPKYYAVVKPDGNQVVYLKNNGKQLYQLYSRAISPGTLETERLVPFDSALFGHDDRPITYELVWRPGASQIFFYTADSSVNQSLLLDVNTGQICSFNLGEWVYFARWSPNGRYLAMVTSKGSMHPIWVNYDLNVLDTLTGKLYKMDSEKIGYPNLAHTVSDMAWAPDNHHLAIIGTSYAASTSPPPPINRLYLVDFLSEEADNLFPSYQLYGGSDGTSLSWSPDGSKILVQCPVEKEGRLCLISVGKIEP